MRQRHQNGATREPAREGRDWEPSALRAGPPAQQNFGLETGLGFQPTRGRRFKKEITSMPLADMLAIGIFLVHPAAVTGHTCKVDKKRTVPYKRGSCKCIRGWLVNTH